MDLKKEILKFYLALLTVAGILFISILLGSMYPPLFIPMFILQLIFLLVVAWKPGIDIKIGEDEDAKKE